MRIFFNSKLRLLRSSMSIQIYKDDENGAAPSGQQALVVLPNGLQITEEELEKRQKDVRPKSCSFLLFALGAHRSESLQGSLSRMSFRLPFELWALAHRQKGWRRSLSLSQRKCPRG